jgi:hypothetical protein
MVFYYHVVHVTGFGAEQHKHKWDRKDKVGEEEDE